MPGGGQGRRIMNFFGVWDERNRVTRTRSPLSEELYSMLVIYVPPSELPRFEEILVSWCLRRSRQRRSKKSGSQGIARCTETSTKKGGGDKKQLAHEIVPYADFQTLGRPGAAASRAQVIDNAIQLIERPPEPP